MLLVELAMRTNGFFGSDRWPHVATEHTLSVEAVVTKPVLGRNGCCPGVTSYVAVEELTDFYVTNFGSPPRIIVDFGISSRTVIDYFELVY